MPRYFQDSRSMTIGQVTDDGVVVFLQFNGADHYPARREPVPFTSRDRAIEWFTQLGWVELRRIEAKGRQFIPM